MPPDRSRIAALPLNLIGSIALMVIGLFAGLMILQTLNNSGGIDDPVAQSVETADYPVCGDYSPLEEIRKNDLKTIMYARHLQKCDSAHTNVTLTFTLSNRSLADIAKRFNIVDSTGEPLILYRPDCNLPGGSVDTGFDGIVVEGSSRNVLFSQGTEIRISQGGSAVKLCEL